MYFTKEFELKNRVFLEQNEDELQNISQEDLDWFMIYQALADYYEDVIGFSAGGALHIVLADYNLEDACIKSCMETCRIIQDTVGLTLCNHLLQKDEETREFMVGSEWFFRQYVEQVISNVLHENLDNYYRPKVTEPVIPSGSLGVLEMLTFEGLLKPSQQWLHSFDGQENWRITFKGESKLIPTAYFKFAFPKGDKLENYIVLDEIHSFSVA